MESDGAVPASEATAGRWVEVLRFAGHPRPCSGRPGPVSRASQFCPWADAEHPFVAGGAARPRSAGAVRAQCGQAPDPAMTLREDRGRRMVRRDRAQGSPRGRRWPPGNDDARRSGSDVTSDAEVLVGRRGGWAPRAGRGRLGSSGDGLGSVAGPSAGLRRAPRGWGALELEAVSCTGTRRFMAVVYARGAPSAIAQWDGSAWAVELVPAPTGSTGAELNGVDCPAADRCVAVGSYDGATPDRAVPFDAVSCLAPARCIAVGHGDHGPLAATRASRPPAPISGGLAELWDVRSWRSLLRDGVAGGHAMVGISCPTSSWRSRRRHRSGRCACSASRACRPHAARRWVASVPWATATRPVPWRWPRAGTGARGGYSPSAREQDRCGVSQSAGGTGCGGGGPT